MALRSHLLNDSVAAETLYLGGGTPSLLTPDQVATLLSTARTRYTLSPDAEITLEANPGTITTATLTGFREAGVNRLSLGVQSFDNSMLKLLGRVHTASAALDAVATAREAGFDNIGMDLMHSLPGQTPEAWRRELQQALAVRPQHISAYGLTVEEGTPLHYQWTEGKLALPDDETGALMFRMTTEILCAAGYEQYEIANYALPGCRSRHNQVYWQREPYLGFGAAAHSFQTSPPFGRRWHNPADPTEYLQMIATGHIAEQDAVVLTRREAMAETFFLGLRTSDGVNTERFLSTFDESVEHAYGAEIERLLQMGLLQYQETRLCIPAPHLILSNQILARFI